MAHIIIGKEIYDYCKPGEWIWVEYKSGMFCPMSYKGPDFKEPGGRRYLVPAEVEAADYGVTFRVWDKLPLDEVEEEWRDFE